MTAADLEDLRQAGFTETAVFDTIQIVSYFNYITRVADASGLEPEEFIKTRWGAEVKPR